MDDDISAVFCPCGHAVACSSCAKRCVQCPVCRAPANHTQPIFLPLSVVKEGFTMNNGILVLGLILVNVCVNLIVGNIRKQTIGAIRN